MGHTTRGTEGEVPRAIATTGGSDNGVGSWSEKPPALCLVKRTQGQRPRSQNECDWDDVVRQ